MNCSCNLTVKDSTKEVSDNFWLQFLKFTRELHVIILLIIFEFNVFRKHIMYLPHFISNTKPSFIL